MQRFEVSGAVRPIYGSLGVKRLSNALWAKHLALRIGQIPIFFFVHQWTASSSMELGFVIMMYAFVLTWHEVVFILNRSQILPTSRRKRSFEIACCWHWEYFKSSCRSRPLSHRTCNSFCFSAILTRHPCPVCVNWFPLESEEARYDDIESRYYRYEICVKFSLWTCEVWRHVRPLCLPMCQKNLQSSVGGSSNALVSQSQFSVMNRANYVSVRCTHTGQIVS